MILFAAPEFERMGATLRESAPHLIPGGFHAGRFQNCELYIGLDTAPAGEECVILGSISPPDERLLTMLLLAHTLRKEGARRVTGVFPYLAYSRQDKNKSGESLAAAWTGSMAFAAGFDRVLTVDVHSPEDERLFEVPLLSISPAALFGAAIGEYGLAGATIVAPDEGAIPRCEAIRAAAGLPSAPIPWLEKRRGEAGIEHMRFIGEVGNQALLVDDILDTGATLVSACRKIFQAGVEDIQIMVTHGLFTGNDWEQLWLYGVSRIFRTDTAPAPIEAVGDKRIVTLSAVPLLAEALMP